MKKEKYFTISNCNEIPLYFDEIQIPKNKLIAIVGNNGSGKSTLLDKVLYRHSELLINTINNGDLSDNFINADFDQSIISISSSSIKNQDVSVVASLGIHFYILECFLHVELIKHQNIRKMKNISELSDNIIHFYNLDSNIKVFAQIKISSLNDIIYIEDIGFENIIINETEHNILDIELKPDDLIFIKIDNQRLKDKMLLEITLKFISKLNLKFILIKCKNENKYLSIYPICENTGAFLENDSFNVFGNAKSSICKTCKGKGHENIVNISQDRILSMTPIKIAFILENLSEIIGDEVYFQWIVFCENKKINKKSKIENFTQDALFEALNGNKDWIGLNQVFQDIKKAKTIKAPIYDISTCDTCNGTGLTSTNENIKIAGKSFQEIMIITIDEAIPLFEDFLEETEINSLKIRRSILQIIKILKITSFIGLGHCFLNRMINKISFGELKRLNIIKTLSNHLSGIIYLIDCPSEGLDNLSNEKIFKLLRKIVNDKNTVMFSDTSIENAKKYSDWIIEIEKKSKEQSVITASYKNIPSFKNQITHSIDKKNKNIDYINEDIVNKNTLIIGASGSGKTKLIYQKILPFFKNHKSNKYDVVYLDHYNRTKHFSNKNTVLDFIDSTKSIYKFLCQTKKGHLKCTNIGNFSLNNKNGLRCKLCEGNGYIKSFILNAKVKTSCPSCGGTRWSSEIQNYKIKDVSIDQILKMNIQDLYLHLHDILPSFSMKLKFIIDNGGSNIITGLKISDISCGEMQILRIAKSLNKSLFKHNPIIIFDEPFFCLSENNKQKIINQVNLIKIKKNATIIISSHCSIQDFLNDYVFEL